MRVSGMSNGIDQKDKISKILSRSIDIIFISSPKRTSFGILLGVVCKGGTDIICQIINKSLDTTYIFWICAGILVLHVPDFFLKHRIDEKLETEMHYLLEVQKYGNLTQTEMRSQWRQFIKLIHERAIANDESESQHQMGEKSADITPV